MIAMDSRPQGYGALDFSLYQSWLRSTGFASVQLASVLHSRNKV